LCLCLGTTSVDLAAKHIQSGAQVQAQHALKSVVLTPCLKHQLDFWRDRVN
jgi:hypothetical protein